MTEAMSAIITYAFTVDGPESPRHSCGGVSVS